MDKEDRLSIAYQILPLLLIRSTVHGAPRNVRFHSVALVHDVAPRLGVRRCIMRQCLVVVLFIAVVFAVAMKRIVYCLANDVLGKLGAFVTG